MSYFIVSYVLFLVKLTYLLLEMCSIAMGCIYTEAKNYPREPAAHVAISEISLFVCYTFLLDSLKLY